MIKFLKDELKRAHDRNDHLQKMIENQQVLMLKNQEMFDLLKEQYEKTIESQLAHIKNFEDQISKKDEQLERADKRLEKNSYL